MKTCPSCTSQVEVVIEKLNGYKKGTNYDILYCQKCNSSFSDPLEIDEDIYNYIYENSSKTPGYDRYYRYANDVLFVKNPLNYLGSVEDTYWAVQRHLEEKSAVGELSVLEVGCGLGYLTYAINKSGIPCKGIDISNVAIADATERYGDYYQLQNIYDYCKSGDLYDTIILTEVIEHIPDAKSFVRSLKDLTRKGGTILITTPNKDKFQNIDKYWHTELPPVHLWWLSKKFFENLAVELNMTVQFLDFSVFNASRLHKNQDSEPWRRQTLNEAGEIEFTLPHNRAKYALKRKLIDMGLMSRIRSLVNYFIFKNTVSSRESTTLGVIMKND